MAKEMAVKLADVSSSDELKFSDYLKLESELAQQTMRNDDLMKEKNQLVGQLNLSKEKEVAQANEIAALKKELEQHNSWFGEFLSVHCSAVLKSGDHKGEICFRNVRNSPCCFHGKTTWGRWFMALGGRVRHRLSRSG